MYPFTYIRPASVSDAVDCLLRHPEARPLSGGMTLIPTLKQRLSAPTHLIDLSRLAELKGIDCNNGILRIGAATRHVEVEQSDIVRQIIPSLADLASLIGDQQVRNRGTIGGSVANSDPAADYPAAILALKATIITNHRHIPADKFFTGLFETALEKTEIIVAIEFQIPVRSSYIKHRHTASGYAVTGIFIAEYTEGDIRIAVTGAGPFAFRWKEAEDCLIPHESANRTPALLADLHPDLEGLNHDTGASRAYRANLIKTLTKQGLENMLAIMTKVN